MKNRTVFIKKFDLQHLVLCTLIGIFGVPPCSQGKTLFNLPQTTIFSDQTAVEMQDVMIAAQEPCTIIAEITPEKLLNGYSDQSPHTILRLKKTGAQELLVFCLKNSRPQIAVRNGTGQWDHLESQTSLEAGRRTQIAVVFNRGHARFFINGQAESNDAELQKGSYDKLEPGRSMDARKFLGEMHKLLILDEALSPDELKEQAENLAKVPVTLSTLSVPDSTPVFPRYKLLKTAADEMQLINGGIGSAVPVPWNNINEYSLMVSITKKFLGEGNFLYHPVRQRTDGMPDYSENGMVQLPAGKKFQVLHHSNGLFDLLCEFSGKIYLFKNTGTQGSPKFQTPGTEIPITFENATAAPLGDWAIGDINNDDIPDLLLTTARSETDSFWPDHEKPWKQKELPNTGFGKGYGIGGRWLGERFNSALFAAIGQPGNDGTVHFEQLQKIFLGQTDFQVQWRLYLPMTPALLESDNSKWIVLFGDGDQLLALKVTETEHAIRCADPIPLLQDGKRMQGTYFKNALSCIDLDHDGQQEILAYGNPGRVIVFKGPRPGEFAELPPLRQFGGPVGVDTLAVPCRTDWDQDGLPDLIIGDSSGYLTFRSGTKDPTVYSAPQWLSSAGEIIHHQAGPTGSFQGPPEKRWGYLNPTVGDWDGDNIPDIIVNDIKAEMQLYRHGSSSLDLARAEPFTINEQPLPVAWRSRPAILPEKYQIAGSSSPCLLYMNVDGDLAIAIPEETGSTKIKKSVLLKYDNDNPIHISAPCGMWGRSKFSICDWDMDGKWDIVFGSNKGTQRVVTSVKPGTNATPFFMRNIGSNDKPVFKYPEPIRLKSGELIDFEIHVCSVWPTDLDNDGKPDLIIGGEDGRVYYFYRSELDI